jgi:hypothetical protein
MSRGTGRGFQHALVDQLDGQPSSKRPYAGSNPVERAIIRQLARGYPIPSDACLHVMAFHAI